MPTTLRERVKKAEEILREKEGSRRAAPMQAPAWGEEERKKAATAKKAGVGFVEGQQLELEKAIQKGPEAEAQVRATQRQPTIGRLARAAEALGKSGTVRGFLLPTFIEGTLRHMAEEGRKKRVKRGEPEAVKEEWRRAYERGEAI